MTSRPRRRIVARFSEVGRELTADELRLSTMPNPLTEAVAPAAKVRPPSELPLLALEARRLSRIIAIPWFARRNPANPRRPPVSGKAWNRRSLVVDARIGYGPDL